jgi:hypothetical protein
MLDQHDRQTASPELADDLQHLGRLGRIHAGSRLVQQQQPRPQRQRARDLETPPVSLGQAIGGLVLLRE